MLDFVLFGIFPYVAIILAFAVGIYRYFNDRISYSSFSSQFLEKNTLFWGSVPWHYGILAILLAHLLALIFPSAWMIVPDHLYVLEVSGLALALFTLVGLGFLLLRRLDNARVFRVTSVMDWILVATLLVQVDMGFMVALFYRWGSQWYLYTAVPYLVSLLSFDPQIQYIVTLPWLVKLHIIGGFVIIALFPFTRLMHLVTFPFSYLWRPYQVVIWNRSRQSKRSK
ncbi:MAG: Nitrite oxidoreductase gamma subunit [Candidatus Methanoperedens nitroreducens]|uniref:Nitrite oxidoreductase gamma subunit n=1 Tax=Candidatus Methanoperedens nitratireducens TaxID=1392998 RepID=A0A0P8CLT9_9EURY|nr:respiratory nitrate reductase subunit gamma [Candidatus Methanoperedens sp. BLZ2]KAB2946970.1 MAG: respiratory nitrate reductase subunit gamma [Candidatus Methanoperedens sp.]KPQ44270.1 MAG: Nitrite oxidoreductase gamma subunit [Candidatus Methanoperedens sp. BLZ1]MBZ0176772.1 respiratory nitrate reductase subunit gamma [Candidatus Methanoperedens nitroreducens]MCX9080494.1 respiratory nitrate reductase subunit gamma [Candidatus Methanoperedens sp.]